ncbi:retinoblastoma-associated protein-like [Oscarella lobularis]|uniref:retinoblastoma-associated protein-like n=1 Tax=Oscarella lobularis TaxID=121494 RepID=UPI0033133035
MAHLLQKEIPQSPASLSRQPNATASGETSSSSSTSAASTWPYDNAYYVPVFLSDAGASAIGGGGAAAALPFFPYSSSLGSLGLFHDVDPVRFQPVRPKPRPPSASALASERDGRKISVSVDIRDILEACGDPLPGPIYQFHLRSQTVHLIQAILTETQATFVERICQAVGPNYKNALEKYFLLTVSLYYRTLESILEKEQHRLSEATIRCLLTREALHRSLLACCAQVILLCYSHVPPMQHNFERFAFPWILDTFRVRAFDLLKVIETLVLHERHLTLEMIQHLQQVEFTIVQCMAWQEGSPLFRYVFDVDLVGCFMTNDEIPSRDIIAACIRTQLSDYAHASSAVAIFYRKVKQLSYYRLKLMCNILEIPPPLEEKVWTLFQFVYICTPSLMMGRTLDQIMLCSIYGICKVVGFEMQFRRIVTEYRQLPSSSSEVYCQTMIRPGEYDSIIVMYNSIFMPALKTALLKFLPEKESPHAAPPPDYVKPSLSKRPCRAASGLNVYISPLRKTEEQMTPRTRALYSFGDSLGSPASSVSLTHINEMMKRYSVEKGTQKKLELSPNGNTAATPPRPDGSRFNLAPMESGFCRRLTDLVHERMALQN